MGSESFAQAERVATQSASDAPALTARVDAVLAARWAEAKVSPAAVADDGEFLRRVSLDLIGKIPTAAEARDFLDDPSTGKRLALVERLLDSPAYTTRATEICAGCSCPRLTPKIRPGRLRATSRPGFARRSSKRLATTGSYARSSPPSWTVAWPGRSYPSPAGYYAAKEGKPENIASGVARVFLGIRLECAQCHNHPFASWKREQFWSLAAFFADVPPPRPKTP